jgi:mRNA interferase MazF
VICDRWDVVVVPFPFVDKAGTKRRPALGLSQRPFNEFGHTILAMITSKMHTPWPGDCDISDTGAVGLRVPCMGSIQTLYVGQPADREADRPPE